MSQGDRAESFLLFGKFICYWKRAEKMREGMECSFYGVICDGILVRERDRERER